MFLQQWPLRRGIGYLINRSDDGINMNLPAVVSKITLTEMVSAILLALPAHAQDEITDPDPALAVV